MKKTIIIILTTLTVATVGFGLFYYFFLRTTTPVIVETTIPLSDTQVKVLMGNIATQQKLDSTYRKKIFEIPGFKSLNDEFENQIKTLNVQDTREKLGMIPAPHNVKPEDIMNLQFDGKNLLLKYKK